MKYFILTLFSLTLLTATAQKVKPTSSNDFVLECMKYAGESPTKQMVIWFPYDFWQMVGEQMKASPELIEHITKEMSNYMMFAVVDYTMSASGLSFKTEEEIRGSLKLLDSSKNVYKALEDKDISSTAKELLASLEPVMAQMLGQFGEGMRVFLFDSRKINGRPAIDIAKPNYFTLSWAKVNLKWTLPLASVLPPKSCPVDRETMKGNWNYCPVHGVKLDK
jgi:hypothetical protein